MGLQLSAKGATTESDVGSGKPLKGFYLVMIKDVDETFEKQVDKIIVDFECLAGTTPDQRGKVLTEYFATSEKAIPRLTRLAMCVGLLRPDEVADVEFIKGRGCVLFIEVEDNSYPDKTDKTKIIESVRVSFSGMWSIGNPDAAHLHQVPEIAAKIAELRGGQGGLSTPANPTPTPTGGGDKSKWGALLN